MQRIVLLSGGALVGLLVATTAFPATLVREGRPAAVVVLPKEPDEIESLAGRELIGHVEKMSGAKLPTSGADAADVDAVLAQARRDGHTAVLLGRIAAPPLAALLAAPHNVRGTLVLKATADQVLIGGVEEGTAYAVSELLEQLGVRWFMPGELGTVIPRRETIEVAVQQTIAAPSFPSRWFQMPDKDWQVRLRCGGPQFPSAHGLPVPRVKVDPATGAIQPAQYAEFFSLRDGKRTPRQHCLSNPKLIAYVAEQVRQLRRKGRGPVVGMGPNDGGGFCQCDACRALDGGDFDPFSHEPSVTDRYIWFFNQVLEQLGPEDRDTRLAFYIYHTYMRPPVRWKPNPRIVGALAPIGLDRVHGFSNPMAPEKSYARWLYAEWGKLLPELYDRGYWSNLACPGFPFIIVHRLRDEIPACHALGVKGWRVETFPNYGPQLPSMYVAAKLMWNHRADVDALLRDFYQQFFGPAAEPMGRYITRMDAALRDGDHCTGSAWDMPHFYPPPLRREAHAWLDEGAKRAAGRGVYEQRVRMIAQTFEMLEAFCAMMDARARVDFPAAQRSLQQLDAVAGQLMAYQPVPMLSAGRHSTYVNYMRRFFRPAIDGGYQRVSGGNRLVAAAHDEWDFHIDPQRVGDAIGLWRAETTGGNWQRLKTSSSSWSNQGLRYYKGLAWYRQTLDVPAEAIGRRTFLWCGGVDEKAKVWLNDQPIGVSHGAAFSPFELDATPAVRRGRNVLVLCVANEVVNELGTGGIVAPVLLYAPAAGDAAQLDNGKHALGETFP